MVELEWIRQALHDRRISVVAEKTGLSEPTIRAVRDGKGEPKFTTVETLARYILGSNPPAMERGE